MHKQVVLLLSRSKYSFFLLNQKHGIESLPPVCIFSIWKAVSQLEHKNVCVFIRQIWDLTEWLKISTSLSVNMPKGCSSKARLEQLFLPDVVKGSSTLRGNILLSLLLKEIWPFGELVVHSISRPRLTENIFAVGCEKVYYIFWCDLSVCTQWYFT